jgi:hypothetical protein
MTSLLPNSDRTPVEGKEGELLSFLRDSPMKRSLGKRMPLKSTSGKESFQKWIARERVSRDALAIHF